MNTRAIGRELEQFIVDTLNDIGIKASLSKNSGCSGYNLGDINNNSFIIEAKYRDTKDLSIKKDVWQKLTESIPLHSKRMPMYVLGNNEEVFWVIDTDTFKKIVKGWIENDRK